MKDDTVKLAVPAHAGAAAHAGSATHVGAGVHHIGQLRISRRSGKARGHHRKRAFDIVVSALLLVCLAGVFAVIALLIKLDSPGPVFFRVRRVGYRGRPLLMLKFRKMRDDARGGPLTLDRDPRLTRVGRVLTRARLDELPQLWDVLRGRMSLIGPRPEDPGFVALHDREYHAILEVRPGITGLSQIAYKAESEIVDSDNAIEDYVSRILPQKLTLDQLYARTASLTLDLRILYWTVVTVVLHHPVSVNRLNATMKLRRRPPSLPPALPSEPEIPESVLPAEAA
ncbi:MAG TPA: sugar transferase [Solirubrobacteraceae bacterium]|nr:sugar transferase [Solirubrobacteraceae bacterium]